LRLAKSLARYHLWEVAMLRRFAVSALLLTAVVALPRPFAARASTHAAVTNVSFSLNWLTNVEFASIWVAQQKGYWKQAGLTVTAEPINFSTPPEVKVGTGKVMFGFEDGAAIVIARGNGIPIKAIWPEGQQSPFAFATMPKSGITTVQQFKGKRIGYQEHEKYVLETMLNHVGMTLADVTPQVIQFDPVVLLTGKVDASLVYISNEPIQIAQQDHIKVNVIPASKYGYNFYSDVLFTADSTIKSNPGLVRKVVSVLDRGWRYAVAHPTETAHIVVPALDKTDSVAQQTDEMRALTSLSTAPGAALGSMTAAKWQYGINLLTKYKQIKSAFPASDVFTTQFLPR